VPPLCANGHAVSSAFSFCPTCGAPVGRGHQETSEARSSALRCPNGHLYEPGDAFCSTCAIRLGPPPAWGSLHSRPPSQTATAPQGMTALVAGSSGALVPSVYATTVPRPVSASHLVRPMPSPPPRSPPAAAVKDKSVGAALVLTFFFGPLGLLYSSVLGAVLLFVIGLIVGVLTLGFGLVVIWPASMIWGALAASSKHSRYQAWLVNQHGQAMRGWPPY